MALNVPQSALIVDDEAHVRQYVRLVLISLGVKAVHEAASVAEAREVWNECLPDCLVLDINMPGESGLDFLKELREVDQDVPVVMLSGNALLASVRQAAELGADGFIRKDSPRAVIADELRKAFATDDAG